MPFPVYKSWKLSWEWTGQQQCGVLVFLWDSDSRIKKFRTPDSDYGLEKPGLLSPGLLLENTLHRSQTGCDKVTQNSR